MSEEFLNAAVTTIANELKNISPLKMSQCLDELSTKLRYVVKNDALASEIYLKVAGQFNPFARVSDQTKALRHDVEDVIDDMGKTLPQ